MEGVFEALCVLIWFELQSDCEIYPQTTLKIKKEKSSIARMLLPQAIYTLKRLGEKNIGNIWQRTTMFVT